MYLLRPFPYNVVDELMISDTKLDWHQLDQFLNGCNSAFNRVIFGQDMIYRFMKNPSQFDAIQQRIFKKIFDKSTNIVVKSQSDQKYVKEEEKSQDNQILLDQTFNEKNFQNLIFNCDLPTLYEDIESNLMFQYLKSLSILQPYHVKNDQEEKIDEKYLACSMTILSDIQALQQHSKRKLTNLALDVNKLDLKEFQQIVDMFGSQLKGLFLYLTNPLGDKQLVQDIFSRFTNLQDLTLKHRNLILSSLSGILQLKKLSLQDRLDYVIGRDDSPEDFDFDTLFPQLIVLSITNVHGQCLELLFGKLSKSTQIKCLEIGYSALKSEILEHFISENQSVNQLIVHAYKMSEFNFIHSFGKNNTIKTFSIILVGHHFSEDFQHIQQEIKNEVLESLMIQFHSGAALIKIHPKHIEEIVHLFKNLRFFSIQGLDFLQHSEEFHQCFQKLTQKQKIRKLELKKCRFSEANAISIFQSLIHTQSKSLRVLDISGNELPADNRTSLWIKNLIEFLKKDKLLTFLNAFELKMSISEAIEFLDAIEKHPSLKYVRCDLGEISNDKNSTDDNETRQKLEEFLQKLPNALKKIKVFTMNCRTLRNRFNDIDYPQIMKEIQEKLPNIQYFQL
eukprot:403357960